MGIYYGRTLQVKQELSGRPDILETIVHDYDAMYDGKGKAEALEREIGEGTPAGFFALGNCPATFG